MYLLFDIGGTKTRVAVAKNLKKIDKMEIISTPCSYKEGVNLIVAVGRKLAGRDKLTVAAGGVATPMDKNKSRVIYHSEKDTFRDWVGKPLRVDLRKKLSIPVYLENDAVVGGLGEAVYGAGRGYNIVAFLTVSTGLGGAKIVDGGVAANARGFEPAWSVIDASGSLFREFGLAPLGFGAVSGSSIERRLGKKPTAINSKVFWRKAAHILAFGVHNVIIFWSPDIVVIGGSVMKKVKLPEVREKLKKLPTPFKEQPAVKKAILGDACGLYGALAYLRGLGKS